MQEVLKHPIPNHTEEELAKFKRWHDREYMAEMFEQYAWYVDNPGRLFQPSETTVKLSVNQALGRTRDLKDIRS